MKKSVFLICLIFIVLNILYTLFFKRAPYIEFIGNAITHPLRFFTGLVAAGSLKYMNLMLLIFLVALSIAILKRKNEIEDGQVVSRRALKYYNVPQLAKYLVVVWIIMLIFTSLQKGIALIISIGLLIFITTIVVGAYKIKYVKKFMKYMW